MKPFTFLIAILFCLNLNAQKGKIHQNAWYEERPDYVKIPSTNYSLINKGKLYYFLSNDNDILCVDIKVEDQEVSKRILTEGMIIWFDMDGRLSRKLGIRFPTGSQHSGASAYIQEANTIEIIGFTGENARRFPSDNNDTFRGYVKYDNEGILIYKMIIPIAKLPVRNSRNGIGAMPFNLGVEFGAFAEMNGIRGRQPVETKASDPSVLFWINNVRLATSK